MIQQLRNMPEKSRILVRNTVAAVVIKGLSLVVSFLSTPAYIRFFDDTDALGVWFTILSILFWALTFDFGIGNGLRNHLVIALGKNDRKTIQGLISSAFFSTGIISIVLLIGGTFAASTINWNVVLNVSPDIITSTTLQRTVFFALVGIAARFFLTNVNSIFYALQQSSVNNFLALLVSVLLLAYVYVAPGHGVEEKLVSMAVGYAVLSNLPIIVAAFMLFLRKMKDVRPDFKAVKKQFLRDVLSIGVLFFICQILYMVLINTNEFFITRLFGPDNTVKYQIYYKLTSLISMGMTLALTPLWSTVTKAMSEGDYVWLQSIYRKLTRIALIAAAFLFLLVPVFPSIIDVWVGKDVLSVEMVASLVFAFYGSVFMYQAIVSTIVCGLGRIRFQAISYTLAVIVKLALVGYLSKLVGHWVIIVALNAIVLLPYCILEHMNIKRYFIIKIKEAKT